MEVIWINNVNYRVDEQALQWRPARCHRAHPSAVGSLLYVRPPIV